MFKLRVARSGEGKRGGFRTIVALMVGARAFYLLGYAKNEMENLGDVAERNLRRDGRTLQSLTEDELALLIGMDQLREIEP